ncbi:MAG: VWA domain-containing protein [Siphonobacter sp.]
MIFNRELGQTELIFIILFGLIYVGYLGRTIWYAYQLKTSARSAALKFFLRFAAMGALVIALLEPSFGDPERNVQAVGRDIFMVVDVSHSMDATDIQPSRLQRVKFELSRLVTSFPNDRFGLIVFSSGAYLQCPLTFDRNALSIFIEALSTKLLTDQGSALQPALQMALEKQSGDDARLEASKIVILFSDGENFASLDTRTQRSIRRQGIHFYAVGVGTQKGSRIPDENGYLKNEEGEDVITSLQTENLDKLALNTGGQYFEITAVKNDMARLSQSIQTITSRLIDQRSVSITANKYHYFLLLALVLLSLDVLITVRTIRL